MKGGGAESAGGQTFVFFTADMSNDEAQKSLDLLKQGIIEIQNGNASSLRFEELYRKAYTLVLHKHGDLLYEGVENVIVNKLVKTAEKVAKTNNDVLVDTIINEWEDHVTKMGMIRDILMYMDKTRCEQKHHPPVYDLGLIRFLEKVLRHNDIIERIRHKLLKNVYQERSKVQPFLNRQQMRNCLRILHEVDVNKQELYVFEFERWFLKETVEFYKKESNDSLAHNSIRDYLRLVEQRTLEEEKRADGYLDFKMSDTKKKLMRSIDTTLVYNHLDHIVENPNSGMIVMFRDDLRDDLARLYKICDAVDRRGGLDVDEDNKALKKLSYNFGKYIEEEGKKIVDDAENRSNPQRFVQHVLDLLGKHTRQVELCFDNKQELSMKLTETFSSFINKDMCAAKYLSMFVDTMLRTKGNGLEAEFNKALDDVMVLFKYIKDKDIFEDFHRSHLSLRLLQHKQAAIDAERNMIARLKQECGYQYTSKMEGMFRDIHQSKEIEKRWKAHLKQTQGDVSLDFTCQVLTTGFWPWSANNSKCALPDEVTKFQVLFTEFYRDKHKGRKLTYNLSHGQSELLVEFDQGKKELSVNTYQMCILMLFNRKDTFTYAEIKRDTAIADEDLERNILSLAHPKVRVLCKNPNSRKIADDHQFRFNRKYKNQRHRIQIPLLKKQAKAQPSSMPPGVREQRKNRVDAAIVRIMKSRKNLQHNQLVSELIKQLSSKFSPDPPFLKKRIESLIEREFLERDKDDWRTYHYLA